jgi:hypothetical protein
VTEWVLLVQRLLSVVNFLIGSTFRQESYEFHHLEPIFGPSLVDPSACNY